MRNRLYFWGFCHQPKLKYAISSWYIFPYGSIWFMDNLLRLSDVWKGQSYVMFLSLRYSRIVSFILSTTFSITEIPPWRDFPLEVSVATSLFSIFIHQNTKITTGLNIYNILEERPKVLLKMFLIDVDRLTLLRRSQNVIFEYIF